MSTRIPYADENWPIVTGCAQSCPYCWARAVAHRFGRSFAPTFHKEKLAVPIRWRKSRRVLVAFTGDLFDPAITDKQIVDTLCIMAACHWHTFMVLTKQAQGMAGFFARFNKQASPPLPNVWLGVSITNQADADERIPHLLRCPAAVRYVSVEPLLGPVNLCRPYRDPGWPCAETLLFGLDWVVAGAQSGPHASPCAPAWARKLRDDCKAEGVPFAWKNPTGYPLLDGVRHDALPLV